MEKRRSLNNRDSNLIDTSFQDNLLYRKENILKNRALKITLIYLVFGVFWILFSDKLLQMMPVNREVTTIIAIAKGWLYVAITAILVFSLLSNLFKHINDLFNELVESYQEKEAIEEELRANFEELKEKEKLLFESLERYDLALECSNDIIWELDIKDNVFIIPKKAKELLKLNDSENPSFNEYVNELVKEEDRETCITDLKNHLEGKTSYYTSEYRVKRYDEKYIWVLSKGQAIRDKDGIPVRMLGSIQDITDSKVYEEELYKMAHYDSLTGLINRKLFNEEVEKCIRDDKKFSILFLDLDDFKKVNDIFGHEFGDKLLIHVSNLLLNEIGENNLVSRVGGDEFLILLNDIEDRQDIISLCDMLINLFKNPLIITDKHILISSSIGIVVAPDDGNNVTTLIKRADTAMYKSKDIGKNTYSFFNKGMTDEIIRRVKLEKNLKDSVLDEEFEIYFQPQLNVMNNKIIGMEALIRWDSPKLGRVSPAEFITIAEESGAIERIGNWVLRRVCEQCKTWEEMNYDFAKVSVNISVVQLQQKDFLSNVKNIIEETKIKPEYLKFEITESVVITNFSNNNAILNELMEMGIEIALDDFGTGYSSINYLRRLSINTLKIDKSFVDNIEESSIDRTILSNLMQMANEVDIDVIVEGVESKGQLEVLKEIGCTQIQGYYFSKPLPLNEIEEFLTKQ